MALVRASDWQWRAARGAPYGDLMGGSFGAAAFAGAGSDTLNWYERLGAGQFLTSQDGRFMFVMQHDGNLVIYAQPWDVDPTAYQPKGTVVWSANTRYGDRLLMQGDGNLVEYQGEPSNAGSASPSGHAVWSSGSRYGIKLVMQNDGNLVIYDGTGHPKWATNTSGWGSKAPYPPSVTPAGYTPPAPPPPAPTPVAPVGPSDADLQAAVAKAQATYNSVVDAANRATAAANAHGAPQAITYANQAHTLATQAYATAQAAAASAQQRDLAGAQAQIQILQNDLGNAGALADQAVAADQTYATQLAAQAAAQTIAQQALVQQATPQPSPQPVAVPTSIGGSGSGSGTVSLPVPVSVAPLAADSSITLSPTVLIGAGILALLILKD